MQRPHPHHVGTLPHRRGRERRYALLLRQSGTLDRACESGETFIGRASLLGCNRWIDCPCGTRVLLYAGTATRVPGGWVLEADGT